LFSLVILDTMQGVELTKPSLSLLLPVKEKENEPPTEPSIVSPEEPLLTITMGLRLLQVPPMDMQF
jgi:hypothetical protein